LNSQISTQKLAAGKTAVAFLLLGVLSLIFAVFYAQQTLAFIGLGLAFWGALFLLVTSTSRVEGNLIANATAASYLTADRVLRSLGHAEKAYYIPAYPRDVYLPSHLKGLKETTVFICASNSTETPAIEEMARGQLFIKKPEGALIAPPGVGILERAEKELKADFTKLSVSDLCELLPHAFVENLNLAREMRLNAEGNHVTLTLETPVYRELYNEGYLSLNLLGCPVASAVACALAKASGKTVTVQEFQASPEGVSVHAAYQIVEG
jgi:hypothetical protein